MAKKNNNDKSYGNTLPEVKVVAKYPYEQRVIDTMNASNAEFMQRLRNNDLRMMYSPTGSPSTHIMASEDNYAFPLIQDRHGHLEDIRQYVPKNKWLDNSIENNDAIKFQTEGDARYFGEHYKKYYPEFFSHFGDNQYAEGGPKSKRGATPTRTPIGGNRFRLSDADEESSMSSEEIAEYNRKLEEENTEIARQDAERRARDLEKAKRNGTLKHTSFDKTLESLGEADRKMYQSAKNSHSFDRLRRAQDSLSQGVNTEVATAKGLANAAQQYANEQMEKKQQQMRDIKKGFDATTTALEMGAAGYTIGHLTVPRLIHTNTGWLGKVSDFFTNSNAQLGANAIGSLADGYQLLTADNKFDKYENGIELGGDTAGIVGGLDIVRNSNIFGRYSKPIDTALDTIGLSAATWDIAKNMPPFSYYYGKLKDYVNGTNDTEDNQYADGGEMEKPKHWKELSMADKADVMAAAVRNGVTTLEEIRKAWDDYADDNADDSSYREDSGYRDYSDNRDYSNDSNDSNDKDDNDYSDDSYEHQYLKGGYKPSASIKNRIANWEGSSMATNRSFEAEAKDFWNAIPSEVRNKLSQQQADALYSYSYNVGAGNFKRRAVPSLERYFNGNGSVADVQRHMYATQDSKLRGLAKRRAVERAMFAGQKVGDVPAVSYDYAAKSISYSPLNFSINNNVQTVGFLGPVINNNSINRTKQLMSVFDEEPKQQVIVDDTPEPAYNTLERLQNMYSMLGMDDYAQEIGKYNPFAGLTFAEGGKKATVYKTTDGDYTTANGHPVEQIGWDDNGYARYRDTVTGDLGKAYEPTDNYGIVTNRPTPEQKADMFLKNYTLAQAIRDNQTASNDNLWIENGREKNSNLDYKGMVGGRANAAWEQEHPALTKWGYVPSLVTLGVASYPLIAGGSDAAMATSAGQAISGPLVDMATAVSRSKWMPWADAVTTSIFGADALNNDVRNGNITPETVLELAPLTRVGKGIAEETVNFADKAWHSPYAQYPRYYLGKLYYGRDTELPTLYRKMHDIPQVNNDKVQISPIYNRFAYLSGEESPLITNMTTDVPVRSHSSSWAKDDVLAFPGKTLLGKHVISTRPSDAFTFGDILTINPKKLTYISGRPKALKIAEQRGMKTLTSDQALNVARSHVFGNSSNYRDYEIALQNITRHNFKSPTLKDYKFMDWVFQPQYKSKVIPFQDLSNPTIGQLNNSPKWIGELLGNQLYRNYLSNPKEWRNVLYHPASSVEYQFREPRGIELKDEIPDYDKK